MKAKELRKLKEGDWLEYGSRLNDANGVVINVTTIKKTVDWLNPKPVTFKIITILWDNKELQTFSFIGKKLNKPDLSPKLNEIFG